MAADNERIHILQLIEGGKISAADGLNKLRALPAVSQPGADSAGAPPTRTLTPSEVNKWRGWWMLPLWIGVGAALLGAVGMYQALQTSGMGFWFFCAVAPFLSGSALVALAAGTRAARWLHLRVNTGRGEWPRNIAFSFPVPTRFAAWLLRTFGSRVPDLQRTAVDELILSLDETTSADAPLFVDVQAGENGARVQVYIG